MSKGHLEPSVPNTELLIFLPSPALCILPHLSRWQLHLCLGPKHQNHALLLSFLECHIQSFNKFCWLYLQDISNLWHLFIHLLLSSWSQAPSFFTWITAITSWLVSLLLLFLLGDLFSKPQPDTFKMEVSWCHPLAQIPAMVPHSIASKNQILATTSNYISPH